MKLHHNNYLYAIKKLKKNNINATFIGVEGETHNGVARSPQFYNAINEILKASKK